MYVEPSCFIKISFYDRTKEIKGISEGTYIYLMLTFSINNCVDFRSGQDISPLLFEGIGIG